MVRENNPYLGCMPQEVGCGVRGGPRKLLQMSVRNFADLRPKNGLNFVRVCGFEPEIVRKSCCVCPEIADLTTQQPKNAALS
jgi:hypothetical protein